MEIPHRCFHEYYISLKIDLVHHIQFGLQLELNLCIQLNLSLDHSVSPVLPMVPLLIHGRPPLSIAQATAPVVILGSFHSPTHPAQIRSCLQILLLSLGAKSQSMQCSLSSYTIGPQIPTSLASATPSTHWALATPRIPVMPSINISPFQSFVFNTSAQFIFYGVVPGLHTSWEPLFAQI